MNTDMKVKLIDKEVTAFIKSVEIERGGVTYYADLSYDIHSGYELRFHNQDGSNANTPDWVVEWWEQQAHLDSIEYKIDCESGWWEYVLNNKEVTA